MKNILFLFLAFAAFSCTSDDSIETIITSEPIVVEKILKYDLQDNMIWFDGSWKVNSSSELENWTWYQSYGLHFFEGFLYIHYDSENYELISAEMIDFNYPNYFSQNANGNFYIEGDFDSYYQEVGEIYNVKIVLKEKKPNI